MLSESQIAELKQKHGQKLAIVETENEVELVFRKPKRLEFDRWLDAQGADKSRSTSARELARSTFVYPENPETLTEALDNEPGLLLGRNAVLDSIVELGGFGKERAIKKV